MYPDRFAEHLKGWLVEAHHPGVVAVHTCAEVGRWEQPVGVMLTLSDGWRFLLQVVGAYPQGGAANERSDVARPERFDGAWQDRDDYRQARRAFEQEAGTYNGPKSRRPQAGVAVLLDHIGDVIKRADHPELATVEVDPSAGGDRQILRILCDDKSAIHGLPAGYLAPGATDLAHPAHQIPKEWT